jgi:RimJ/RimL family protein N-acetyltransferase
MLGECWGGAERSTVIRHLHGLTELIVGGFAPDKWEVGVVILPAFWGRAWGAKARAAGDPLRLGTTRRSWVISVTLGEHLASCRVVEKCGLALRGTRRPA